MVIYVIESLIPLPVPIPGVKPGLANVVTLFILFSSINVFEVTHGKYKKIKLTSIDALIVLFCRIMLGAAITGRIISIVYSLAGGILAFIVMLLIKPIVTNKQIWVCGVFGAVFHNIGQIAAAIVITGTPGIIVYLPVLIIAGIVTGGVTGLIARLALDRMNKLYKGNLNE